MQTFLPHPNFVHSAACLDTKRLGKQRVECMQILNALLEPHQVANGILFPSPRGWRTHPATRMWAGCESALALYMTVVIAEWRLRGYNNSMMMPYADDWRPNPDYAHAACLQQFRDIRMPSWLGDKAFHDSHKSNLLRKDPAWYGRFGWDVPADLPYVWPV